MREEAWVRLNLKSVVGCLQESPFKLGWEQPGVTAMRFWLLPSGAESRISPAGMGHAFWGSIQHPMNNTTTS